ncbi:beta-N-acetylhexosaminidase [Fodinibius halophilus]|uniref:beta-N-acetylhexosaminidase n=1 Tax=Fodinibius halophilus TaxID=1736908 RepID=A0A6M1T2V2_9BACT|nr:beta-N-acetylhexosaminidase [Fodinibius halophilus]NGP88369.1 beta-N-acetylhexosaminidase [Fodinibius halophilus]
MTSRILLFAISIFIFCACQPEQHTKHNAPDIIPEPASLELKDGTFQLDKQTTIYANKANPAVLNVVTQLKNTLDSATGYDLGIQNTDATKATNSITFTIDEDTATYESNEAYHLSVSEEAVELRAPSATGLFYGIQSLFQLLPPEIYQSDYTLVPQNTEWNIPAVEIQDYPRFEYRGMHLDVARHFFPVEFVKRYIDLMAMHKMNRFHWHLTEDQGWRIEIKQYPKLTEIGAWRDSTLVGHYTSNTYDTTTYGGYYTQEEVREVVAYAQKKHITVIPEIEMPGHASAALASYPQYGCVEGKDYQVKTTWGIFEDIYCPREETFTFLKNVLTEVMELFPSKYIHIGGDEAPKKQWEESEFAQQVIEREELEDEHELQSYFITRIEKFLNKNGRQIIGWDEILEGGLAPNATVMSWRGIEGGIKSAKQKHNVIMTPTSHVYLDYYQADEETEPLAIGGFISLEKIYNFDPVPEELNAEEAQYILGAQGNIWSEYMHSGDKVEYMAYPRASALSEVVWSPHNKRNWTDFWRRMQVHFDRFDVMGVNAAKHYENKIPKFQSN